MLAVVVLVSGGVVAVVTRGQRVGLFPVLALIFIGVVVIETSVTLMAVRRADTSVAEAAVHALESERRTAAEVVALHAEVEQLRTEQARLAARLSIHPPVASKGDG